MNAADQRCECGHPSHEGFCFVSLAPSLPGVYNYVACGCPPPAIVEPVVTDEQVREILQGPHTITELPFPPEVVNAMEPVVNPIAPPCEHPAVAFDTVLQTMACLACGEPVNPIAEDEAAEARSSYYGWLVADEHSVEGPDTERAYLNGYLNGAKEGAAVSAAKETTLFAVMQEWQDSHDDYAAKFAGTSRFGVPAEHEAFLAALERAENANGALATAIRGALAGRSA